MLIPNLFNWIDGILFVYIGLSIIYLFLFAILSRFKQSSQYPESLKEGRIVVLFPAYHEDRVIESSTLSFLEQNYPSDRYEVIIISDHMKEETNNRLSKLPVRLFQVSYENSSKAKAMNEAIRRLNDESFDMVVIMDADNIVGPNFLQQINNAFQSGAMAIQCHRKAKNKDTDIAFLDAASEEMNNSYFRKGHVRAGLSSTLSGSGMAFEYHWFCKNITKIFSCGEDKELERLLLKQHIYIEYLDNTIVLDEKIKTSSAFYKQRQRWLAAQAGSLKTAFLDLPKALWYKNFDYTDKLLQSIMPPRILLLGFTVIIALLLDIFQWQWSIKWWCLLCLLFFTFYLAIPKEFNNKHLKSAIKKIPLLFFLMFLNLFRLKGMNKKFVHTEHDTGQNSDKK